ncbi:MAG: hypothetical protein CMF69_02740 [Magnetovibrio sp.]|nr:hypothetical protein [Magnetovibrio sp.]
MKFDTEKQAISSICNDINDEELIPHPEWQRKFVWDRDQQKCLIDTINKQMPLPSIFVWEKDDDHKLVVDGQQRLTTLKNFHENKFSDEDGKKFNQYEKKKKKVFEKYQINITIIRLNKDETELDILELFWKLNGGVGLTMGELIASHVNQTPKIALARNIFFPNIKNEVTDEDNIRDEWADQRDKWHTVIGMPKKKINKRKKEYEVFTPLVVSALELDPVALTNSFKKIKKKLSGDIDDSKKNSLKRVLGNFLQLAEEDKTQYLKIKRGGIPSLKKIASIWGSFILKDCDPLVKEINQKFESRHNMWIKFFIHISEEKNETDQTRWKNYNNKKRSAAQMRREILYVVKILQKS